MGTSLGVDNVAYGRLTLHALNQGGEFILVSGVVARSIY
jgi:hypothetical protein